jgi:hypothetical protein
MKLATPSGESEGRLVVIIGSVHFSFHRQEVNDVGMTGQNGVV